MQGFIKIWWVLLLRGILSVVIGLTLLIQPHLALEALTVLFGAYALTDGVFAIWMGVHSRKHKDLMRTQLLEGILGVSAGIVAVSHPQLVITVLVYLAAVWALLTGLIELFAARELFRDMPDDWHPGLIGIASLLSGGLLLAFPHQGLHVLVWLIGSYAILFGSLFALFALRLRRRHPRLSQHTLGHTPL